MIALDILHWVAGAVVLAESLNKLERVDLQSTRPMQQKIIDSVKAIAWILLALGGAGAIISPLAAGLIPKPNLQDVCVIVGCAALIIRTRIKECAK